MAKTLQELNKANSTTQMAREVPATPKTGDTPASKSPAAGTPDAGVSPAATSQGGESPAATPQAGVSPGATPRTEKSSGSKKSTPQTPGSDKTGAHTPGSDRASTDLPNPKGGDDGLANEIAPNEKLDEETLPGPDIIDKDAGEDTERLSDMSEDEGLFGSHSKASLSSSRLMSWLGRNEALGDLENPCIFRYGNWGQCNARCWEEGKPQPMMRRKVIASSIIQARGQNYKRCPDDLAERYEEAPCNFYKCPIKLSTFKYSDQCFYNDANKGKKGGCYRIRMLPIDEYRLIHIDSDLIQPCDECPDFIM